VIGDWGLGIGDWELGAAGEKSNDGGCYKSAKLTTLATSRALPAQRSVSPMPITQLTL